MKALFPGSFDPITNGHLDLIKRASKIFNQVVVAVMTNITKKSMFSPEEKLVLIENEIKKLKNVSVVEVKTGLTVDLAKQINADVIIRGVRNVNDYQFEQQIAVMNRKLDDQIETLLLPSSPQYNEISSSLIKEIAKFKGDISKFVPLNVAKAIEGKINEK
ncbi:pantetheine-phosphate adenylyltransferase [Ligilactobacillus sp. LYQ135]